MDIVESTIRDMVIKSRSINYRFIGFKDDLIIIYSVKKHDFIIIPLNKFIEVYEDAISYIIKHPNFSHFYVPFKNDDYLFNIPMITDVNYHKLIDNIIEGMIREVSEYDQKEICNSESDDHGRV